MNEGRSTEFPPRLGSLPGSGRRDVALPNSTRTLSDLLGEPLTVSLRVAEPVVEIRLEEVQALEV
jgi:hypothetical protein